VSLLTVDRLSLHYGPGAQVLHELGFSIGQGESVGLVGESGSGKTQTAFAVMGLLADHAQLAGSIDFDGVELCGADADTYNCIRTQRMAMVFQDPQQALNPYLTIGAQLTRILQEHRLAAGKAATSRVQDMLQQVGLPEPERQFHAYPHQLSGGMRQRAMIAAALLGEPDLLIADEPTTALDVTVQAQILDLLARLKARYGLALLLITHDLGIVAGSCERMLVLDEGRLIEEGATRDIFAQPKEPRSKAMLAATPAISEIAVPAAAVAPSPLLDVRNASVSYFQKPYGAVWRRDEIRAVRDATFAVAAGETVALVGESGSGKTSLVRALLGLLPLAGGDVQFLGAAVDGIVERRAKSLRRDMQLVFQDPVASLNPSMRVAAIVAEPLRVHLPELSAQKRQDVVEFTLGRVGLDAAIGGRFPHQLSGGQAQRVALARALIVDPKLLVLDEAVAALDGEVRGEILALLRKEQAERGLAILFISHDLSVVKSISHRVLVMYLGRICEHAASRELFARPRHPYTRALLDSVPVPDPNVARRAPAVSGEVASVARPPAGCSFHPRCPHAIDRCRKERPTLQSIDGVDVACHRAADLTL
jgi:oligopeptide/dipeptide ABC transporter ATP-binding protein